VVDSRGSNIVAKGMLECG